MSSQRRGPWSQSEDDQLIRLVGNQGPLNWVRISHHIHSRTPKQCRERYHQNLKPSLNHDPITPEEGVMIDNLVREIGKKWAEIARRLNNRSDNAVKNWWNGSMNRRKRIEKRTTPRRFYDEPSEHAYSRGPAPLRLETGPSRAALYPGYAHCSTTTSPSNSRYPHGPWPIQSGLPSPSTPVPFVSSPDRAPSLLPDTGSLLTISPTSAFPAEEPHYALPPLRGAKPDMSTSPTLGGSRRLPVPSPSYTCEQRRLPSIVPRPHSTRLPSIRNYVDHSNPLPTAPTSPSNAAETLSRPLIRPRGPGSTRHVPSAPECARTRHHRISLSNLVT
ncbi:Homeodomain-like protein [Xylariaceae sp. FL1019]|nr:Homeodomain-like protein [Xylariaceae sp. FL1019]